MNDAVEAGGLGHRGGPAEGSDDRAVHNGTAAGRAEPQTGNCMHIGPAEAPLARESRSTDPAHKDGVMKKIVATVAAVSFLGLLSGSDVLAQRGLNWRGSGGWGPGTGYGRMYDPKTVATVQGEVVSVETFVPNKGMSPGIHVTIKTAKENSLSVHLGPEWYISGQDTMIAPGDNVEVTGSRITFGGKPAMIAARITKGTEVLLLRDEDGSPVWAGWRRRQENR